MSLVFGVVISDYYIQFFNSGRISLGWIAVTSIIVLVVWALIIMYTIFIVKLLKK